jgi:hypothetical protein
MKRLASLTLLLIAACSNGNGGPGPAPEVFADVKALRESALALQLRPDNRLEQVEIQYVHLGVNLDSPFRGRLTMSEAEARAADVLKQARAGADFDNLVYQHSWDGPELGHRPGCYIFVRKEGRKAPSVRPDSMISTNLRNAVWRLEPGEIGAVEYHRKDNDSGYFIVRRLTADESKADDPVNFEPANEEIAAMRKTATEVAARTELDVSIVRVQHVLIGRYAPGRSNELKPLDAMQAERLAAEVFAKAVAGDEFDALVRSHTYDSHPGIFTMSKADGVPDALAREGMVAGFWMTAWRLQPGEVGIALYDRYESPYGYHIIKRLE